MPPLLSKLLAKTAISHWQPGMWGLRGAIAAYLVAEGGYLHWRVTRSLDPTTLGLGWVWLWAEIYCVLGGATFLLSRLAENQPSQLAPPARVEGNLPRIDVVIRSDRHPSETVAATARAALALDYPPDRVAVYLLDREATPAIRELAARLQAEDARSPEMTAENPRQQQRRSQLHARLACLKMLAVELAAAEERGHSSRLQLKSEASALKHLLTWFGTLKPATIPVRTWLECQTILGEGFDNALYHAHENLPVETPIEIEILVFSQAIALKIWDCGEPFDLDAHRRQMPLEVDLTAESGRGIGIMERLSDHLSYTRSPDGRNCLLALKSYLSEGEVSETEQLANCVRGLRELLGWLHPQPFSPKAWLTAEIEAIETQLRPLETGESVRCRDWCQTPLATPTQGECLLLLDGDRSPHPQLLRDWLALLGDRTAGVRPPRCDPRSLGFHPDLSASGDEGLWRQQALASVTPDRVSPAPPFRASAREISGSSPALLGRINSELIATLGDGIAEAIARGRALRVAGWEIVTAPDGGEEIAANRERRWCWVQGTLSAIVKGPRPSTLAQRWEDFRLLYAAGFSVAAIAFLGVPLASLTTGMLPVRAYDAAFFGHFLPAWAIARLALGLGARASLVREIWGHEREAIADCPLYWQALWSAVLGRAGTPPAIALPSVVVSLTVVAIALGLYRAASGDFSWLAFGINAIWSVQNAIAVGRPLRYCQQSEQPSVCNPPKVE